MKNILTLVFALLMLSGCATRIESGTNTVWSLDLRVSHADGSTLYLKNSSNTPISSAVVKKEDASFVLDKKYIESCVTVTDEKGKSIVGDDRTLYLGVRLDFEKSSRRFQQATAELQRHDEESETLRRNAVAAELRLVGNESYRSGSCARREPTALPAKPRLRCSGSNECRQDGAAICYTRFLGTMGCEKALEQVRIPGLLSSPGCAATAARLAGEKYEMGDAVRDGLLGMLNDTAQKLRNSDSVMAQLLGYVGGGMLLADQLKSAQNCTENFVNRELEPLRVWNSRVEQIRRGLELQYGECDRDYRIVQAFKADEQSSDGSRRAARDRIQSRVTVEKAAMSALESDRRGLQYCVKAS